MSRLNRSIVTIASASLLAASAAAAQGTKDIASCKPLFDANTKTTTTPSHMYMQEGAGASGGAPTTTEMVRVGGATYVQVHGKWQVSPITPAQMAEQEKENIQNAKALVCHKVGTEAVNGVPASVFTQHSETESVKSDGKIWVANGTGLILREELDTDLGDAGGKTHHSIRFEYANVKPPIAAK